MKTPPIFRSVPVLVCALLLFSCKKDALNGRSDENALSGNLIQGSAGAPVLPTVNLTRSIGSPTAMGNGTAKTWFTVDKNNIPQEIAIELSRNAVENLPEDHERAAFLLNLPDAAKTLTPFDHIVINWNHEGHAPFFYQLPHFDFHFYMTTVAERTAIPSYATSPAGFDNNPPAGFLPASYIAPPGGEEEQMGKHWVDAGAPELPWNGGATFTKSFIYGSYDGKVNFLEPMVTLATLESGVASSTAFAQPVLFEKKKYYPTVFNIYKNNGNQTYNITLSGFVLR